MKKSGVLFLSILLVTACGSSDTEQVVTIDGRYSVSLPSFLEKTEDLNDDASLQYQNIWKELYVIVIDEPIVNMQIALEDNDLGETYPNDLEGYSELLLGSFEESITVHDRSAFTDTKINDMPARLVKINGRADGVDVFYHIAFVQGKEDYYQVMTWTLASREGRHKDKMDEIIYSLKEEQGGDARQDAGQGTADLNDKNQKQ